jgi:competence protein ComFC
MIDRLLGLIAPHICCSCGQENAILCENCFFDIIDEPFSRCLHCQNPAISSNLCSVCRDKLELDDAYVVSARVGAVKRLIDLYKFENVHEASRRIVQLLDARLPRLPEGTVVCYIPDIPAHRRQRGYDHMKRIAKGFANTRHLTTLPLLSRQTFYSQRGLTRKERLARQNNAFSVTTTTPIEHCLLLDDIYTTGATLRAGVAALRAAGIQHVYVGLVARQPLDEQADL